MIKGIRNWNDIVVLLIKLYGKIKYISIKEGKDVYKSQTFDQSLLGLYSSGTITREEALANATSRNDLLMDLDYYDAGKETKVKRSQNREANADKDILALKKWFIVILVLF